MLKTKTFTILLENQVRRLEEVKSLVGKIRLSESAATMSTMQRFFFFFMLSSVTLATCAAARELPGDLKHGRDVSIASSVSFDLQRDLHFYRTGWKPSMSKVMAAKEKRNHSENVLCGLSVNSLRKLKKRTTLLLEFQHFPGCWPINVLLNLLQSRKYLTSLYVVVFLPFKVLHWSQL